MKRRRIHVGLRAVKTSIAIVLAMILVEPYPKGARRIQARPFLL